MPTIPGRTMSYWLAHALREKRQQAKVSVRAIAQILGADQSTIWRIEKGQTIPREVDRYVAAYAKALGLEDGRALWRLALEAWMEGGNPPILTEDLGQEEMQQLEREIRETELRDQARHAGPMPARAAGKASASQRRRAAR